MGLRDRLAIQRTKLANERTILAYLRTSILLFATGITMLKLLSHDKTLSAVAIILLVLSIGTALLGVYVYVKTKQELS